MNAEGQSDLIAFLTAPSSHGLAGPVEVIETHISRIFLVGDRAFKTKRAVRLPYVDFSTADLRLAACRREVELNNATAPGIYLGVRRITRQSDGGLAFDGDGSLVDAAVEMRRFDQTALFDRMAGAGQLTPALMTKTARMIVDFHRHAPIAHSDGGAGNIEAVLDINRAGFATSRLFRNAEVARLDLTFRAALRRHAALLDRRESAGKVRRCHGDLHLRNICLIDGLPRLFDCIEFNDRIATVDVLYDLAFLLMDLHHRQMGDFANLVANRYLDESDDENGFVLLPFFMAIRAAVRAHVTATQAHESGDPSGILNREAKAYFLLAGKLLEPHPERLVVIGGLSGSGKTTVAEQLAPVLDPAPGARIVESDRIRKAMHGVPAETRLPEKAYRPEVSDRVYRDMVARAARILDQGRSVVADAVFDRQPDRDRIAQMARDQSIPFLGVWLETTPAVLRDRVEGREQSPSDATIDILSRQLQRDVGTLDWRRVDAGRDVGAIVREILSLPADDMAGPPDRP